MELSKIIYAIDLDDVVFVCKEAFYRYYNENFNADLDWRNPHYQFGKEAGIPQEEGDRLYHEFTKTDYFNLVAPIKDAFTGLQRLSKTGENHGVTSRPNYLEERTIKDIDYYFKNLFSGIEMGNHHNPLDPNNQRTKLEICQTINASMLFEDQIKYAQNVSPFIPVILFDKPWNQGFKAKNVYRVGNWKKNDFGWSTAPEVAEEIIFNLRNKT